MLLGNTNQSLETFTHVSHEWQCYSQVETSHTSKDLDSLTISTGIWTVITVIINLKIILIVMKETYLLSMAPADSLDHF